MPALAAAAAEEEEQKEEEEEDEERGSNKMRVTACILMAGGLDYILNEANMLLLLSFKSLTILLVEL